MTNLVISDIHRDEELDVAAVRELRGGVNYGFLSGLFAGQDSMFATPSIVQNFMIDYDFNYDQTIIELAPVHYNNVASNGSIANSSGNTFTSVIGQAEITALGGLLSQS
jgi:hypothetical protein